MKNCWYIAVVLLFVSCEYFGIEPKEAEESEPPIASVYQQKLYAKDIENLLPRNLPKEDSLVLVKSLINSWATQQLLLHKAQENTSEENNQEITDLVKNYEQSLYINDYKERLIKQQLDTIVSDQEINNYYQENKDNFRLNEELVSLKYIQLSDDFLGKKDVIKKFKSSKEEDFEDLENQTINFKSFELRDSIWVTVDDLVKKIPPFQKEPKEKLLKISKYEQKQDSLDVYLVTVKDVLKRNDIAPKSYVISRIKQLILHQRKSELIRKIEKTLIQDAINNQNFKEY